MLMEVISCSAFAQEKKHLLHAMVDVAKITPKRIMVGAGACAAADAIVLADAAVNHRYALGFWDVYRTPRRDEKLGIATSP